MKITPASPAATVLFVVGPELRADMGPDPYTVADYVKAKEQLQALGYNVISAHEVPADQRGVRLANCHGVVTTDQFSEKNCGGANLGLLSLAHSLRMPDLPVIAWAKCAAPDAREWFPDVFDGVL